MTKRGVGISYDGDLRQVLLDAATELIADSGAEQVSLRGVARQAGVSHAAPAHHFGDKAGLLTAVAAAGFEILNEHLSDADNGDEVDPMARLDRFGNAYIRFALEHRAHFDVMFRPNLIDTNDAAYIAASGEAIGGLREQIKRCQDDGWHASADTTHLASATWATVHGLSVLQLSGSLPRVLGQSAPIELMSIANTLIRRSDD